MEPVTTKYGVFFSVTTQEFYPDGPLKGVVLGSPQPLETPYGQLIPQYENDGTRRKFIDSVTFYRNGNLKSISLQNQSMIHTKIGIFPAEYVIFYENGGIKRLFPLNGKLSGFWTEADEYALAKDFQFDLLFAKFTCKMIGLHFYENENLKSITFWPKETVTLHTPLGPMVVRIGFSLHPDGSLASVEPQSPTLVKTPIGSVTAFDINALGIHADDNSLKFKPDGQIQSLITSSDRLMIKSRHDKEMVIVEPTSKPSLLFEGKTDIVPVKIEFREKAVSFGHQSLIKSEFAYDEFQFQIENLPLKVGWTCTDCSGCAGCDAKE